MDMLVDVPEEIMPGAGFNFEDVTDVFKEAAAAMEPGSFVFMDEVSLYDAMGAFEIGEPRLDSGLVLKNHAAPPFNPTSPLLPEELCWILDRAFAYEMEWHSGNLLCHSVFTLLYIHALAGIESDFLSPQILANFDSSRPPELLFQVLRSWVMGLLKCCDLSWRELSKGGVHDTEDWQGEKCDVSLLEGTPAKYVVSELEDANMWLHNATNVPILWRNALRARVILRKIFQTLLQLMQADVFSNPSEYQKFIDQAREQLMIVRLHPSPQPEAPSPALHAFDPSIARRLKTFVPIRVLPVPTPEDTWKAIDRLLDGWQEVCLLAQAHCLSTWEIVGNIQVWLPNPIPRIPYLRSYTQSTFYDGLMILNRFSFSWMVDRFFFETVGVSYTTIIKAVTPFWAEDQSPLPRIEKLLYKARLLSPKEYWHKVYDMLTDITTALKDTSLPKDSIIMQLPKVPLVWRLSAIREVVFSGFQLELFSLEERPFAYQYVAQVIEEHLTCLDDLLTAVVNDSSAYQELFFQHQFLTALQLMSIATFVSCMSLLNFDSDRVRPAFFRRYKWAFESEYDDIDTPVVGHPELYRLLPTCAEIYEDESFSPSASIEMARGILAHLLSTGCSGGWSSLWATDRMEFLRNLVEACDRLKGLPTCVADVDSFDTKTLKWDVQIHPWFPFIHRDDATRFLV